MILQWETMSAAMEKTKFTKICLRWQEAQKALAKIRETAEKIERAKAAKEKADRERKEKMERKKALVDINAGA